MLSYASDLRAALEFLSSRKDEVVRIRKPVDAKHELAAVYRMLEGGPVVVFENVKGYKIPVVSGFFSNRRRVSELLGLDPSDPMQLTLRCGEALANRVKPRLVGDAACKEVVVKGEVNLMKTLPIMKAALGDAGHYITAGVVFAKDPETGNRNLSIHRMQVKGPNELRLHIDKGRHLGVILSKAKRMSVPLEIAVAVGVAPAVMLSSTAKLPLGEDELGVAGAIQGEPVEIVKCDTINAEVPANAEVVLEGELLPDVWEDEGPFQEYPGTYSVVSPAPIFRVKAITHRSTPLFYTVFMRESHMLRGIQGEVAIYRVAKDTSPIVQKVHLTMGSCGRHHAVISVKKEIADHEGLQRNIICAVFAAMREADLVIAVDEDVDVYNMSEVEWALATRFDAAEDLILVPDARSHEITPVSREGIRSKMGIDATAPFQMKDRFRRAEFLKVDLKKYLE